MFKFAYVHEYESDAIYHVLLRPSSVTLAAPPEATDLLHGSNETVMDRLNFI